MALLEIRDIESGYGEVQILWGTSIALEEGKLTSLVGANGAGKTTTMRTVMGQIKPWSGSVWFNGQDISSLSAHAKAELGVVLVPEGRQLFTDMSVEENLEMGASPKRARAHIQKNLELVYEMFPAQRAAQSKIGHDERRRAANVGGGAGYHGQSHCADDR